MSNTLKDLQEQIREGLQECHALEVSVFELMCGAATSAAQAKKPAVKQAILQKAMQDMAEANAQSLVARQRTEELLHMMITQVTVG